MKTFINVLLFYLTLFLSSSAYPEAVTDGTVGTIGTLGVPKAFSGNFTIPQNYGTTVGNNLFHSFSGFNINTGESATFTNTTPLQNVISRVTGINTPLWNSGLTPSGIYGSLISTIPNANFYFINPAGVAFGPNAKVDVPAAFYVSSANSLRFADGSEFSATNPSASVLTIVEPVSFGFLGTSNGTIGLFGAKLATKTGQDFNIVSGNNIGITNFPYTTLNSQITAKAGGIRLTAVGQNNTTVPINGDAAIANGSIIIDNASTLDVSGNGSGKINMQGGNIYISGSKVLAENLGVQNANNVQGINIIANNLGIVKHR